MRFSKGLLIKKMDTGSLLGDFEAEAKAHIEKIETAFLDADSLSDDPELMNGVFRAAHSIKGTAGFFSLVKIVGIAHELESVFMQVRNGKLIIDDIIADIVLQGIDCLKDLINSIDDDSEVDTKNVVDNLKKYSEIDSGGRTGEIKVIEKPDNNAGDYEMPFDCNEREIKKSLKKAVRHGHKIYCVNIAFNRSLGKYYRHPEGMIVTVLSIGSIIAAIVDSKRDKISLIKDFEAADLTSQIITALAGRENSTLELLVTSVLEPELFAVAIEINTGDIRLIPKETVLTQDEHIVPQISANKKTDITDKIEEPEKPVQIARDKSFSVRLDVSAINNLMDLSNEMILTRNRLLSAMSEYRKIPGLAPILHDMNRLTSEIQEKVMLTRMQPVSVIFSRFPRIIRDTAKMLDKDIQVDISGEEVTLDKYLLDSLVDPITQLVKNSADHGLESSERRLELGKPPKGKITLSAYMRDGLAVIEVSDDGAGIDADALRRKSIENRIATEEKLDSMKKSDIFALMFEPGISTAKHITNLSGRGVGMDIVKTNIEKLGGSIEVDSELGKGTAVRLKMPLTLSVTATLIVTIDSVQYAVPEANVERIVRVWSDSPSKRLEKINKSLVLSLNGRIIPVVTMRDIEAKVSGQKPPQAEILLEESRKRGVNKLLALKAGGKILALMIDDAVKTEEILVNPLPVYLKNCPCYSGAAVLGNGNAVMILDAEGIIRLTGIDADAESEDSDAAGYTDNKDKKQVIIFKCSGAEYFAVETSGISRIETIDPQYIQEMGGGRFINISGENVRIVRPEYFAHVKKHSYNEKKLYMITLRKSAFPIGLLAGKVLDKAEGVFKLDKDNLSGDFISGTSVFDEKILIFLNPAAIAGEIEKQGKNKVKSYF